MERLPIDWGPVLGDVGALPPGVSLEAFRARVAARRAYVEAHGGAVFVVRVYSVPDGSRWAVDASTGCLVLVYGRPRLVAVS